MKIERAGKYVTQLAVGKLFETVQPKPGRYSASFELAFGKGESVLIAISDLSADELGVLRTRFERGDPLKVTIE